MGGPEIFARKGGQGKMEGSAYYIEILQNNCLNKMRDDQHCNSFNSFGNYNGCSNYSCK